MQEQSSTGGQKRAVAYCRVSTVLQKNEGTSLNSQATVCAAYCQAKGHTLVGTFSETFSGASVERPAFDRVLAELEARRAEVVVIAHFDRFTRAEPEDAYYLRRLVRLAGGRLEFTDRDYSGDTGEIMFALDSLESSRERKKILRRTTDGKRSKVENGKLPGHGPEAFGYRYVREWTGKVEGTGRYVRVGYEIVEAEAVVVERIFRDTGLGLSMGRIAADLDRDGIPTPGTSSHWLRTTLRTILMNPLYKGQPEAYRFKTHKSAAGKPSYRLTPEEERVVLEAPAIVTAGLWDQAQERLAFNRLHHRGEPANPTSHLLRGGYARCAACGGPLYATYGRGNPIYRCGRAFSQGRYCTSNTTISATILDAEVWKRVVHALTHPEMVIAAVRDLLERGEDPLARDLAATEATLRDLDGQAERLAGRLALVDDLAAALVAQHLNTLVASRDRLRATRDDLARRLAGQRAELERLLDFARTCERVSSRLDGADYERRRWVLAQLQVQAIVHPVNHEPRFEIRALIDLDESPDMTGMSDASLSYIVR